MGDALIAIAIFIVLIYLWTRRSQASEKALMGTTTLSLRRGPASLRQVSRVLPLRESATVRGHDPSLRR